jgi:Xaa-Pro aminopeptidase
LRPGISLAEVDQAARGVIQNAGLARYFNHGLGHGLGLEIHESPRLAPKQQQLVRAGMVITLEPGVYMPGWGGVRVEDDVLVTRAGARVLTHVSADLADLLRA